MTILITAFEPFQQETTNATMEALSLLPDRLCGVTLEKRVIPVVFGEAIDAVTKLVDDLRPDAVVCLGQASGRTDITPERVAINVMDARIADNAGNQPVDAPIRADGPAAYFSTLPVKAMVQAMKEAGAPASLSNTAGTFVCNHVAYGVAYLAKKYFPGTRTGFLHIPYLPQQAATKRGAPSMALETMKIGTIAAIRAIIAHEEDLPLSCGKED